MAHNTTVFRQLLDLLPRHEFDAEARRHQKGQRLRVMSRWAQFVALGLGQLAGLQSLRDIVGSLRAQPHKLYHLGVRAFVSRSSLARVNTEQPYTLYETLFGRLLARCQQRAPRHGFRLKNKLFAVDASTIDLCLAAFPWASFRRTKGAIKLHVGLDPGGTSADLPQRDRRQDRRRHGGPHVDVSGRQRGGGGPGISRFRVAASVAATGGDVRDPPEAERALSSAARARRRHPDRGDERPDDRVDRCARSQGLSGNPGVGSATGDEETQRSYVFVTNNTTWVGKTIADLYKSRWQIELFFKWIKQNLKVKRFVGRSKNAVLSQLWVATCMYLLLAYLKFVLRLGWSLHRMLRVLQLNLFDRRPLVELFTTPSPPGSPDPQMLLWC